MKKNTYVNISHTKEEIEEYLKTFKLLVQKGRFYIPNTDKKPKNKKFIEKYKLTSKKQKEMLLALEVKENYTVIISFHEPEKNIKKLFI